MSDVPSLKAHADRINAVVTCVNCSFDEPFADYLDREARIDRASKSIEFGCPACDSDTVELGRRTHPTTFVVSGLEELNEVVGE